MLLKFLLFLIIFITTLESIELKQTYYVNNDLITIDDILKNKNYTPLFKIQEGRYTKRVKSKKLIKLLKNYKIKNISSKHSYIKFIKETKFQKTKFIDAISKIYKDRYKNIEIHSIEIHSRGYVEKIPQNYEIVFQKKSFLKNKNIFSIKTKNFKQIFFNYIIDADIYVYKSIKDIKRAEELNNKNVKKVKIKLKRFNSLPIQQLLNTQASHHIKAGSIITKRDIQKLFLIKRGENINIFYKELNMNITFSATAIQNGSFNDIIKVKTSNGKIIKVRVIGRKKGQLI